MQGRDAAMVNQWSSGLTEGHGWQTRFWENLIFFSFFVKIILQRNGKQWMVEKEFWENFIFFLLVKNVWQDIFRYQQIRVREFGKSNIVRRRFPLCIKDSQMPDRHFT